MSLAGSIYFPPKTRALLRCFILINACGSQEIEGKYGDVPQYPISNDNDQNENAHKAGADRREGKNIASEDEGYILLEAIIGDYGKHQHHQRLKSEGGVYFAVKKGDKCPSRAAADAV